MKLIGIVSNYNDEKGTYWINANYIRFYNRYGTVILIDPLEKNVNLDLDLLILPGGLDCAPNRYGAHYDFNITSPNVALEIFDHITLPQYVNMGVPMLCECRGHQSINIHFGGKLTPHLPNHPQSGYDGEPVHYVCNDDKSLIMMSSSNHHQGIALDQMAPNFEPLLFSYEMITHKRKGEYSFEVGDKEDIVESMIDKERRIFTVQNHPEKNFFSHFGERTCQEFNDWFSDILINEIIQ